MSLHWQHIIVIIYVDDPLVFIIIYYAPDDSIINDLITKLKADKIWICKEASSTKGFLDVDISVRAPDGSFTLTQFGLINPVINDLSLQLHTCSWTWKSEKDTPAF